MIDLHHRHFAPLLLRPWNPGNRSQTTTVPQFDNIYLISFCYFLDGISIENFELRNSAGNVVNNIGVTGGEYSLSGTLHLTGPFSSYSSYRMKTDVLASGTLFGILPFNNQQVDCLLQAPYSW